MPPEAAVAATGKASVLVVDDHALLRTGVANIINQEPDLRVVAEAGNGLEAVEAFERYHPDVTLLDLRMPVMDGVEAVRQIRERDPRARVIVLTTYDTDEEISRALKAGAKAFVLKDISADDLVTCIRDVLAGKTYLLSGASIDKGCTDRVMDMSDPEHLKPELGALRRNPTGLACLSLSQSRAASVAGHESAQSSGEAVLREGAGSEDLQGLINQ